MDFMIQLSGIQLLDLFFRFAAAGQLLIMAVFMFASARIRFARGKAALVVCLAAYVLLTAPIQDAAFGWFRPPLLLLTDLTSYALLLLYWQAVHGVNLWHKLIAPAKFLAIGWFAWLSVFFLGLKGHGPFHDIHHVITFLIILVILADAAMGYRDDLVEKRRSTRALTITVLLSDMLFLTLLEVTDSGLRDHWLFSFCNAALLFLLAAAAFFMLIKQERQLALTSSTVGDKQNPLVQSKPTDNVAQTTLSPAVNELKTVMAAGLYTQNDLNIGKLAKALKLPEHQLRGLINQELGFDNFSHFVSSYRLDAVCEKLQDPALRQIPILTLALESGFNSVASFNRIFKRAKGVTPSDYRAQFQN
ncbi:AraC family transcriptional regulator [Alteromonas lipolytica]|uniref:HTH araC/xylS-type domain-containing protein n=1 Tax=Alteromonas lipolytica TaxID=1856405 RepID=A0A1E8FDC0_9ALTE|nr:helix-turn-helix domain-containing protein [Alteromonas lipolytica]OFI33756.1 hypothetical protein BFC17_19465 [Alteromonas lipolytica]GGF68679.1 transcriptional regulator [Alteromonas lipolytica]